MVMGYLNIVLQAGDITEAMTVSTKHHVSAEVQAALLQRISAQR
jgi:hypothetical protein